MHRNLYLRHYGAKVFVTLPIFSLTIVAAIRFSATLAHKKGCTSTNNARRFYGIHVFTKCSQVSELKSITIKKNMRPTEDTKTKMASLTVVHYKRICKQGKITKVVN